LAVIRSNLNTCSEGTPERETGGRFKRWVRQTKRVNVRSAVRDTIVAEYRALAFGDDGRQVADVQCVFARGDSADVFIREYFKLTAPRANGGGVGEGLDFFPWMSNVVCGGVTNGVLDCYFFTHHVQCEVLTIAVIETMPLDGEARPSKRRYYGSQEVSADGETGACRFVEAQPATSSSPPSTDAGTISYSPPSGGFGGGALPGGEYYYTPPSNANCFLGGCPNGGGGPCYVTDRSPTTLFGAVASDCVPPPCNPRSDPNCIRGIFPEERAVLETAFANYFADTTAMTDAVQRYECTLVGVWTKQVLSDPTLAIGKYSTFASPGSFPDHLAQTTGDTVHIDIDVLGASLYDIAITIMHESVHRYGTPVGVADHGGNSTTPPNYSLPFWRSVEASEDRKSCHKPF
jgi:hypothetical protein